MTNYKLNYGKIATKIQSLANSAITEIYSEFSRDIPKFIRYLKKENVTILSTRSGVFKHLLTLSNENLLLMHSKLDDTEENLHRTADISYGNFQNSEGISFPTSRQILITEKNRLDIRLDFKQFEFNKELSVSLQIPRNYKRK